MKALAAISTSSYGKSLITPEVAQTILVQWISSSTTLSEDPYQFGWYGDGDVNLRQLSALHPEVLSKSDVGSLLHVIGDENLGYRRREAALVTLQALVSGSPDLVTPETVALISSLFDDHRFYPGQVSDALVDLVKVNSTALDHKSVVGLFEQFPRNWQGVTPVLSIVYDKRPDLVSPDSVERLITIVSDSSIDPQTRSLSAQLLGILAKTYPGIVTDKLFTDSINVFFSQGDWIYQEEPTFIGPFLRAKPALAKYLNSYTILAADKTTTRATRWAAVQIMAQEAKVQPELITPDLVVAAAELITDRYEFKSEVAKKLAVIVQGNPNAATSKLVAVVTGYVINDDLEDSYRMEVAESLVQIVAAAPSAMDEATLSSLLDAIGNRDLRTLTRRAALHVVAGIASHVSVPTSVVGTAIDFLTNSDTSLSPSYFSNVCDDSPMDLARLTRLLHSAVIERESLLQSSPNKFDSYTRRAIYAALAEAYYRRSMAYPPAEARAELERLLDDDSSNSRRLVGEYAFFLMATYDPSQMEPIRNDLMILAESTKPNTRVSAARALELLAMAGWAKSNAADIRFSMLFPYESNCNNLTGFDLLRLEE